MDKKLKKQIDKNFEILEKLQPQNAKDIKKGFTDALSQTMDTNKELPNILTGVGSLNDIYAEFDDLNEWSNYDDYKLEHQSTCDLCKEGSYCKEFEGTSEFIESTYSIYTNGDFVLNTDGTYEIQNDTLTVKCNWERNTFQVIKSEIIIKRGFASMCYPGQCDLDSEGDQECYDLPKDYYLEKI